MAQVVKRYPRFDIKFFTENSTHHIVYDAKQTVTNDFMAESVISLATKNAMEDDSAVFSFVLAGDRYWDRILNANDAVVLKIDPDEGGEAPANPVLLVGLISEVRLEGDYGENSKMYRITGQSFAKAFVNFEVGVIQEVQAVLTDLGWLPDSVEDGGMDMTQKTASQLAEGLVERFMPYMKYDFENIGGLEKFLTWQLDSWTEEERLADVTQFINYEGSLKQFLDDIAAKPFNELFFDATPEEQCQMIMRRTPFDESDWTKLPAYYASSKDVISEAVGINDIETCTIFNISSNNILQASAIDLSAYPQYFPALFKKFGYKKMEVENRYLATAVAMESDKEEAEDADTSSTGNPDNDSENEEETGEGTSRARTAASDSKEGNSFNQCYKLAMNYLTAYDKNKIRVRKKQTATSISKIDTRISIDKAEAIVDYYVTNDNFNKEVFSRLSGIAIDEETIQSDKTKPTFTKVEAYMKNNQTSDVTKLKNGLLAEFNMSDNQAVGLASEFVSAGFNISKLKYDEIIKDRSQEGIEAIGTDSKYLVEFKKRLANWYCENPNFYSGDIVVKGSPDYRLGGRLFVQDEQNDDIWEYYIESVQHDYSYSQGYTTTLGVTRGLQNAGIMRFKNLWGTSEDFKGGLMGEATMEELARLQAEYDEKYNQGNNVGNGNGSGGGSTGGGASSSLKGSTIAEKAANFCRENARPNKDSYYLFGGGHGSADPFASQPFAMDCSAFVWWVYHKAGYDIGGGSPGTTWSLLADSNLETVSSQGQKDPNLKSKMRVGDIIWFYGGNDHVGIYLGNDEWAGSNGFPPEDRSASAGIQVESFSGYWWEYFNGNVKRVK